MSNQLTREQSRSLMTEAIGSVFNACIETGDELEPNGVVEALMIYFMAVYRQADWGDEYDMAEDAQGWVEHMLEGEENGGEGYIGSGPTYGPSGSLSSEHDEGSGDV